MLAGSAAQPTVYWAKTSKLSTQVFCSDWFPWDIGWGINPLLTDRTKERKHKKSCVFIPWSGSIPKKNNEQWTSMWKGSTSVCLFSYMDLITEAVRRSFNTGQQSFSLVDLNWASCLQLNRDDVCGPKKQPFATVSVRISKWNAMGCDTINSNLPAKMSLNQTLFLNHIHTW